MINNSFIDFIKSSLAENSPVNPNQEVLAWLRDQNSSVKSKVYKIPLKDISSWKIDDKTGNIYHESGKFFSIIGINIKTNWGLVKEWDQPIIKQSEIGFLGIITKKINGILHFLLQAKIEPGNINIVQLSPSLQATRSNYTKVHKGKAPLFLEYFNGQKKVKILLDQLQSEQGARFLKKRNRNIIIQLNTNEAIDYPENFKWLSLGQIKYFLSLDNIVNMDTRSVISAIPLISSLSNVEEKELCLSQNSDSNYLRELLNPEASYHSFDEILSWFTHLKFKYEYDVNHKALKYLNQWEYSTDIIAHRTGKYFEVIGIHSEIGNREVIYWDQPMIKPVQQGIMAFIVKKIKGIYHFLVQAKLEPGNMDILEMAPTVQCITGNYRSGENEYDVPFINDVLNAPQKRIWISTYQSEEGGRFYQEQNINKIVEVMDDFSLKVPDNYCWISLPQLLTFIKFNNYLNISARSLISAIPINTIQNGKKN